MEPLRLGARELRAALDAAVDGGEVVAESLRRCEDLVASTNALVATRPQALDEVEGARGPLAGVPLILKDMFVDSDRIPTVGSKVTAHWMSGTAAVVNRLRAAGAIVVAYSNLHEWAIGTTSAVTALGPIANPRHPEAIAGGSSGGSAVALAVGAAPLAVGTDAGGSIRIPSACCGVVGLKPTLGAVPLEGFALPDGPPIDHVGPMARSVDDVRILFEVMAARSVDDVHLGGLRVGIPRDAFFGDLVADTGERLEEVIETLRPHVAEMRDVELPGCENASFAIGGLLLPYVAKVLEEELRERPEDLGTETLNALQLGASLNEEDREGADQVRRAICDSFEGAFSEVDVLLTPTLPGPPAPAATQMVEQPSGQSPADFVYTRFNGPMNLAGVPALSVPVADDLSLTITAAREREDRVFAVGAALEDALDRAFVNRVT